MQTWEEQIMIKQEGITEGRIEGEKIGRLRGKRELLEKLSDKFSIEQISEMLEIDISELKNIMKEIQIAEDERKHAVFLCVITTVDPYF